jgi:hypothetical protein
MEETTAVATEKEVIESESIAEVASTTESNAEQSSPSKSNEISVPVYAGNETEENEKSISSTIRSASPTGSVNKRSESPFRNSLTPPPSRSSTVPTALRAHGEKLTWPAEWDRIEQSLDANHVKLNISVYAPETVSSMMSK